MGGRFHVSSYSTKAKDLLFRVSFDRYLWSIERNVMIHEIPLATEGFVFSHVAFCLFWFLVLSPRQTLSCKRNIFGTFCASGGGVLCCSPGVVERPCPHCVWLLTAATLKGSS